MLDQQTADNLKALGIELNSTQQPLPADHPQNPNQMAPGVQNPNYGEDNPAHYLDEALRLETDAGGSGDLAQMLAQYLPQGGQQQPNNQQTPINPNNIEIGAQEGVTMEQALAQANQQQQQPIQQPQPFTLTPEQEAQYLASRGFGETTLDGLKAKYEFGNALFNNQGMRNAVSAALTNQIPQAPQPQPDQRQAFDTSVGGVQGTNTLSELDPSERLVVENNFDTMARNRGYVNKNEVRQMFNDFRNESDVERANNALEMFYQQKEPEIQRAGLNVNQVHNKIADIVRRAGGNLIRPEALPDLYNSAMLSLPGGASIFNQNHKTTALGQIEQKRQVNMPVQPNQQNINPQPMDMRTLMQPQIFEKLPIEAQMKILAQGLQLRGGI